MSDVKSSEPDPTPSVIDVGQVPQSETVGAADVPPALADHPRYRVLQVLGRGGMGTVYLAEHRAMKRTVALKVSHAGLTARPEAVDRFRREVEAAARLTHPNIVASHDAEQVGDCLFLAMEYVEGTDLARRLKEHGPLPVAEACDCIRQAALGLQYAHEQGLVHRDLKPHNLMRTASGQVKILDFGLVRMAQLTPESGTVHGVVLGTPDYMAPEQADDAHQADIRADIYSLGCTLYHLLGGRVPFPGGGIVDKLRRHAQEAPTPLTQLRPELSPALAAVVDRMMAKDAGARFQTPAEVASALAPWCSAPPEPVARRIPSRGGRRRWRLGTVVAGAVVLGAGALGLLAWLGPRLFIGSVPSSAPEGGHAEARADAAPPALIVSKDGTGDFVSLRQAMREAPAGARLLLRPGHYQETIVVRKPLEIAADPGGKVVIESSENTPLTLSADGVRLRGLSVLTSAKKPALAIQAGRGVVLEGCDVSCAASTGALVTNPRVEVLVRNCTFHDCKNVGIDVRAGRITFEDCGFAGNQNNGAEIFGGASAVFRRCQMNDNTHGVFVQVNARASLEDCTITANEWGVCFWNGARGDLRLCRVHNNTKGVYISNSGNVELHRCKVHSNRDIGIHIDTRSTVTLDDCDIFHHLNLGIASWDAEVTAVKCRITRNTRAGFLAVRSKGRVEDSDLTGNIRASILIEAGSVVATKNNKE